MIVQHLPLRCDLCEGPCEGLGPRDGAGNCKAPRSVAALPIPTKIGIVCLRVCSPAAPLRYRSPCWMLSVGLTPRCGFDTSLSFVFLFLFFLQQAQVQAHLRADNTRVLSAEDFEKIRRLKQQAANCESVFRRVRVVGG